MSNKVQDIFNWYENFTENTIVVNTDKTSYEIGINKNQLPHLLGLQYADIKNSKQKNIRGIALYNYIKNNNLTDEYIYNEISKNQPEKLNAVKERVETFKYFMEHLEKGIVYQNMKSSSNIKSDEFIIETKNHRIMHLGLIDIGGESVFNNFEIENAEIRNLETYFTQRNTKYFQNSPIREKIISIERYTDDGSLEPFSFSNTAVKEQQNIINPYYTLLDRLKSDCDYYLGACQDNNVDMEVAQKHLYAGTIEAQIDKMRELYNHLDKKPEWLSPSTIDQYEKKMLNARNNDSTKKPISTIATTAKSSNRELNSAQKTDINPQEVEAQNVSASFNLTEEAKTIKPQIKNFDREEFNKLIDSIDDIVKSYEQNPELIAEYLAFRSNFYNYSVRNALLIHLQNPYSTFTASFTKWKDLGYSVKKGEKAIRILRPIEKIKYVKDGKTLTVNKNTPSEDKAKIASGEYHSEPYTSFAQAMVFDISQTDCPPEDYPKIFSRGTENADRAAVYECVKEYAQLTGFTVTEDDITSISLGGYYQPSDDTIHINNTLKDDKKLSVFCHELAHGMLHKTSDKPTAVKEFEAESFAAMLQSKLGFLPSEANKEYIKQHYLKAKDLINPRETLKRTAKMFAAASSGITEIMKEKGLITENSRNINREEKITPSQAQDIKSNFMQAL